MGASGGQLPAGTAGAGSRGAFGVVGICADSVHRNKQSTEVYLAGTQPQGEPAQLSSPVRAGGY